jgi:hypothetical protein
MNTPFRLLFSLLPRVVMVGGIGASSWTLGRVSYTAVHDPPIAIGSAIVFGVVCLQIHGFIPCYVTKEKLPKAIVAVYSIKLLVAATLSLLVHARNICPTGDFRLADHLLRLFNSDAAPQRADVIVTFIFVIMFDVLVLVLEFMSRPPSSRVVTEGST